MTSYQGRTLLILIVAGLCCSLINMITLGPEQPSNWRNKIKISLALDNDFVELQTTPSNHRTVNLKNFTLAYEPDEVMMYRYIFPNEDVSPWAPIRVYSQSGSGGLNDLVADIVWGDGIISLYDDRDKFVATV